MTCEGRRGVGCTSGRTAGRRGRVPAAEEEEEEEGGRMQMYTHTRTHSLGTRTRIQLVMLKPSHAAALGTR